MCNLSAKIGGHRPKRSFAVERKPFFIEGHFDPHLGFSSNQ